MISDSEYYSEDDDDVSEYCPSHEDEASDDSSLNQEQGLTYQHQSKTELFVFGESSSGNAKKKRKIPVGIAPLNSVCFMELSQLEMFIDSINRIRGCKTSNCDGNLVPISVKSVGLGGGLCIRYGCNGCSSKQAELKTYSRYEPGRRTNTISLSVQVAFILAGCTHTVYTKTLSHALGMKSVSDKVFLKTVECMYPIVKEMLDKVCEVGKKEMKAKPPSELGSWKNAVTTADGTWQTRGWHSKNATFTLNGALLYYEHLCQKGSDDIVEGDLYPGTSKSSEGYAAHITFQKAKEEGMNVAVHWQDADSSSAKALRKVFPKAEIMLCGGHAGHAHRKILENRQKEKELKQTMIDKYKDVFPQVCDKEYQKCKCERHRSGCGCLSEAFISKAHTNFTSTLKESQSQEKFVKRLKALPRHAVDDHSQCDFHALVICSCGSCKAGEDIKCQGKPYKTRLQLDCKFHALLYEIECHERASQAKELIHPVLKRGHSNIEEASHNVFIRFRSRDLPLKRLHYCTSTNLALLQSNLTYMHGRFGIEYHWIPEVYKRMGLPVFDGVDGALDRYNVRRKKRLEWAQTTPVKKRRIQLKRKRVQEGIACSEWTKKHGHGHTYGDDKEKVSGGNKKNRSRGKLKKSQQKLLSLSSDESGDLSPKRECPLSLRRKRLPRRAALPIPPNGGSPSSKCPPAKKKKPPAKEDRPGSPSSKCPPAKKMPPAKEDRPRSFGSKCPPAKKKKLPAKESRPKIDVGDYVCVHKSFMGGRHLPCRVVWERGDGRFVLYCAKGILKTKFCPTELVPLSRKLVISLTNWQNAPEVSLRSAADETTLVECSNCSVPECSDSIVLSSASERENEASELWVNNGAYSLSHSDKSIILSPKG